MITGGQTGRVGAGDPLLAILQPKKTPAQKMTAKLLAMRAKFTAPVKKETALAGKYKKLGIRKVVIDSGKMPPMKRMNFALQHKALKGGNSCVVKRMKGGRIIITYYVMGRDVAKDPGDLKRLAAARKIATFRAPGAGLTLAQRKAMVMIGIRKLLGAARGKAVRAALVYFEAKGDCETPHKARQNGYEKLSVAKFRREVATLKRKQPRKYARLMKDRNVKRAVRWMGRTKTRYIYVPTRKIQFY